MTQELMYVHACERIIYIELQRSSDLLLWGGKKKKKKRGKKKKKQLRAATSCNLVVKVWP